ncbi:hypothetical protein [Pseudolysinimonas kribbensis]|nr:hypothetical protein [Pseudolysinimonas kribbensis]
MRVGGRGDVDDVDVGDELVEESTARPPYRLVITGAWSSIEWTMTS